MKQDDCTLVAAVNDRRILQHNLLASPALAEGPGVATLWQEGYPSAARAYNAALDVVTTDLVVFVHQDLLLPAGWFDQVQAAVRWLDDAGVRWGVLGCFGSRRGAAGGLGRVYTTGLGLHGVPVREPQPVETLDEIVLIMRRSSGLRFDNALSHFHMYGADICLQARSAGFTCHSIQAFCVHNTNQLVTLPDEFYAGYRYVKRKWARYLPIYTSCMTISRFDAELRRRQAELALARLTGGLPTPLKRVDDPRPILQAVLAAGAARTPGARSAVHARNA